MTYTPPEVESRRAGTPAPAPKTSGHAIAGLIVGLAGLCTCGVGGIAGLVLSIVALKKIDASRGTLGGRGLAIAGIIASAICILVGLVIGLGVLVAFITAAQSEAYNSELESDWDADPDWSIPAPSPGALLPPSVTLILQRHLNAEIAESAEITSFSTTPARWGKAVWHDGPCPAVRPARPDKTGRATQLPQLHAVSLFLLHL